MNGPQNEETSLEDWLQRSARGVGIVFADIVDSTILLHRLKTRNFALVLRAYQSRAAQLAAQFEGRLVDRVGDEVFAAFGSATKAFLFGSELFQDPGHPQLSIRAGVHFGTVQAHDAHLVGRTVHLGARVMEHARGHELWVSDEAKSALHDESSAFASSITWLTSDECELHGMPGKRRLWRAA